VSLRAPFHVPALPVSSFVRLAHPLMDYAILQSAPGDESAAMSRRRVPLPRESVNDL
jgi:hypothetical protein